MTVAESSRQKASPGCLWTGPGKRRRRCEDLGESEARYRSLVDLTPDIIYRLNPDGTIAFISPAVRQLGYTPEELIGRPFEEIVHPEDRKKGREGFVERRIGERRTQNLELRLLNKTRETQAYALRYIHIKLSARGQWDVPDSEINDPGKHFLYTQGVARDITECKLLEEERRKLEKRLCRAEKLETLGTLAGGVAHDLNNVLGVLMGYSELLREKIPEESPLRRYVENILKSSEKGTSIIQDLLTLARRGVDHSEAVNLNHIVSNYLKSPVFDSLQVSHPQVLFSVEMGKEVPNINGSPVHLEKTVMNLISNAAEAISGRGEVTVRTENCYLDGLMDNYNEVREGEYVALSVSDNGCGIKAHDLDKIFEPFYTRKTMGQSGTGLGLAIVWGTVKDHEGYIDVKSEVGKGSAFTLYFPVTSRASKQEPQKLPIERYMGSGESVLVVDDVREQREVAVSILTRLGYRARAVAGGEEAVAYLKNSPVDLIVMDMIMKSGMDGLDAYRQVLKINPGQKAILVSGYMETDRVKKAQQLGAGAYVKKPYAMEQIGLAIQGELGKAPLSSPPP